MSPREYALRKAGLFKEPGRENEAEELRPISALTIAGRTDIRDSIFEELRSDSIKTRTGRRYTPEEFESR